MEIRKVQEWSMERVWTSERICNIDLMPHK